MIADIAEHIIDHILALPDESGDCSLTMTDYEPVYDNGYYLSFKDETKGVLYKDGEEYSYTGLNDTKGNHIYIRFRGSEELTHNPAAAVSSCVAGAESVITLRLISAIENYIQTTGLEKYNVEEYLRNALLTVDWAGYIGPEKKLEIELVRSQINNIDILIEEGVQEERGRIRGHALRWIFTAIDFNVKFKFYGQPK